MIYLWVKVISSRDKAYINMNTKVNTMTTIRFMLEHNLLI